MKKIFMIVDSTSGLNKAEADQLGFGYVPQVVIIDGKEYKDGIDIFMKDSVELIENAKDCKTSVPPVGKIMEIIEESSSKYDEVIYWPMNKGVSSTFNTVSSVAKEFKNVHVMNTRLYADVLKKVVIKSKQMLENGSSIKEILNFVKDISDKTHQFVIPKDISGMIKSGRIHGAKRIILEKGKLIPKLKFTDNGLKPVAIKRNFSKMVRKTIEKMTEEINNSNDYEWLVMHNGNLESLKIAEDAIKELGFNNIREWISPVISVHVGIGGLILATYPKIK